jgi:hypothetical protein
MTRPTPAPEPDRTTEAYAARTTSGRLLIAHLADDPTSPLARAIRAAHLTPEPTEPTQ